MDTLGVSLIGMLQNLTSLSFQANYQASKQEKKTHVITRDAFDNQYGTWTIKYYYHDIVKTVAAEVESLIVEIITDKENYFPGDIGTAIITTNYFEPIASVAHSYKIEK